MTVKKISDLECLNGIHFVYFTLIVMVSARFRFIMLIWIISLIILWYRSSIRREWSWSSAATSFWLSTSDVVHIVDYNELSRVVSG